MFEVSPTSLQTFIDTLKCVLEDCVQYSVVHIPNVFSDGHLMYSIYMYALQKITPLLQHLPFLPHYLAQSDCLAADLQGQEDTRLTLTPSVILNSNYVIMVGD